MRGMFGPVPAPLIFLCARPTFEYLSVDSRIDLRDGRRLASTGCVGIGRLRVRLLESGVRKNIDFEGMSRKVDEVFAIIPSRCSVPRGVIKGRDDREERR